MWVATDQRGPIGTYRARKSRQRGGGHDDVLNFQVKSIREGMIVLARLATGSSWTTDPDPSAQCLSQRCCALAFHHLSNGSSSAAGPRQNRRRLTMRLSQHLLLCPRLRCTAKLDTDKFRQDLCLRRVPRRPPSIPRLFQLVRPEPPSSRTLVEQLDFRTNKHPPLPILLSSRHMTYTLRIDRG